MAKENPETKLLKKILKLERKFTDIENLLKDVSMKLCHIIKRKKGFYDPAEERGFHENGGK